MAYLIFSSSDCSKTAPPPTSPVPTASRNGLMKSGEVSKGSEHRIFLLCPMSFDKTQISNILCLIFKSFVSGAVTSEKQNLI